MRTTSARTVKKIRAMVDVLRPRAAIAGRGYVRRRTPAVLAAAAEEAGGPGDPAADHEAGDGGADEHLALVALDLLAPVRQLGDLAAQAVQRVREVPAVRLDRSL